MKTRLHSKASGSERSSLRPFARSRVRPWVVAAAAVLTVAVTGCHRAESEALAASATSSQGAVWLTREQVQKAGIEVAPVKGELLDDVLRTSGRVAFDDMKVAHIYSPVTGRVSRVEAALGERVAKNARLAVLESPDLGQASADLGKAKADLVAAEHDYRRKRELYEKQAAPQADYEAAQDTYRQAKAEMDRAKEKAALLGATATRTDRVTQGYVLTSPIEGEVVARSANPGLEVQGQYAGASTPVELFTVGSLDSVWVLADVYEKDIAQVHPGAKASVSVIAHPGVSLEGAVDWISGVLDPTTRTTKVRCIIDNPAHLLRPEMFATVQISVPGRRALAIPRSSVTHIDDQDFVFAETASKSGSRRFEQWPVQVDRGQPGPFVPVLHGLDEGTVVANQGIEALTRMF